ncbi:hypothetical protein [Granulicella sibirica]|uniref:Uncharacterized protein n=1 Tax=Granulicella sibirica TaxID=2479048 RepID=A0A4Q0STA9_9BACT|nr:hypothetical protein [Granulicella sibirica]RXH53897.1 hypothetical protein GRAN_5235 [Granulicella sibirica]
MPYRPGEGDQAEASRNARELPVPKDGSGRKDGPCLQPSGAFSPQLDEVASAFGTPQDMEIVQFG